MGAGMNDTGEAWDRICKALDEAYRGWMHVYNGTAIECAEQCIAELARKAKTYDERQCEP